MSRTYPSGPIKQHKALATDERSRMASTPGATGTAKQSGSGSPTSGNASVGSNQDSIHNCEKMIKP